MVRGRQCSAISRTQRPRRRRAASSNLTRGGTVRRSKTGTGLPDTSMMNPLVVRGSSFVLNFDASHERIGRRNACEDRRQVAEGKAAHHSGASMTEKAKSPRGSDSMRGSVRERAEPLIFYSSWLSCATASSPRRRECSHP